MRILLADDERSIAVTLRDDLEEAGHEVVTSHDGRQAYSELHKARFDLLITDIRMPGMDGIELLKAAKETAAEMEVIVITGHGTIETAVEAIRHGAYDYVLKPFFNDDITRRVKTLAEFKRLKSENTTLRSQVGKDRAQARIVGESDSMRKVLDLIRTISDSDEDVLITGETGTGKELVAKMIHELSSRKDGPFVVLSCSGFPQTLLEDEIFGHESGAFTDAKSRKQGRFERAHGGVLFLDDIDDVPIETQVKLLRVLQERSLERLGGEKTLHVNVRVVVASKIDLATAVEDGEFREDLYHRINVIPIHLPPLRERSGDVSILVDHFAQVYGKGRQYKILPETHADLARHTWPGNVRELENAVRRAIAMAGKGDELLAEHLVRAGPNLRRTEPRDAEGPVERSLREVVREMEARHIRRVLKHTGGHRANSAKILGISRKNLWEKMRELEIRDGDE
ncbi:MAG: sigma-54 dependent transcriptional regulator [Planctomycetota bacterium]|nr:sigma-54 dependent transcriptional regulator [Planctomycetota bacterium]